MVIISCKVSALMSSLVMTCNYYMCCGVSISCCLIVMATKCSYRLNPQCSRLSVANDERQLTKVAQNFEFVVQFLRSENRNLTIRDFCESEKRKSRS